MSRVTDKVCQEMQYTNIRHTNTVYVSLRTDSVPIAPNTQQAEWSNVSFGELKLGTETGNRCYKKVFKITIKVSAYSRHDGTWASGGTARLNLNLSTRMYGVSFTPREQILDIHSVRGLMDPTADMDVLEKTELKIFSPSQESKHDSSSSRP
jgi:hypothetical protein